MASSRASSAASRPPAASPRGRHRGSDVTGPAPYASTKRRSLRPRSGGSSNPISAQYGVVHERHVLPGRVPELEQRLVRSGSVPVDERDRHAVAVDRVVRAEIPVANDLSGKQRVRVLAPDGIDGREIGRRIVESADEPTDLDQRVIRKPACRDRVSAWPRVQSLELATTPSRKLRTSRPVVVEPEGPRRSPEAARFEVEQVRVRGRRPQTDGAPDGVADAHDAAGRRGRP